MAADRAAADRQVNTLTGSHDLVASMYPRYADWLAVHARFNNSGVFDSPFSKRVGITTARFAKSAAGADGREPAATGREDAG